MDLVLKSGLPVKFEHLPDKKIEKLAQSALSLINLIGVDTSRDTHYQKKDDMEKVRQTLHRDVFSIDRGIYGCLFCLPGTIDFASQGAVKALLLNPWRENTKSCLPIEFENQIIGKLLSDIQVNKVLNMFVELTEKKVNNARTRRIMLSFVFGSPSFELWSVKYRSKLKSIITHCWGLRGRNIVRAILSNDSGKYVNRSLTEKEFSFVHTDYLRFKNDKMKDWQMSECVAFILGIKGDFRTRMLKAYNDAKTDIRKGAILPPDILDGIRSTYHPNVSQADLLNLTKRTMTKKQKKLVQNKAAKAGVQVAFDPRHHSMTELFIYAYKMGLSTDITAAICIKASKAAQALPFRYNRLGIVFDASWSMSGSKDQPMRPIAIASATREMLRYACDKPIIEYAGGYSKDGLTIPSGDSSLAEALCKVIEQEPDAIFIISDGYENAPAGRTDEIIKIARRVGWNFPIYHINPVSAAESKTGMRYISKDIPTMPISKPEAVGLSFFKPMLEVDPKTGLMALIRMILPMIEGTEKRKEVSK